MQFNKYDERGAYHWQEYEFQTEYGQHADLVKEWLKHEGNILDVGAGDGLITHLIKAVGIDNNPTAVKLAQEKGVPVSLASIYLLPFEEKQFDAVYCGDVIEHLQFPEKAIEQIIWVLKPGGRLYIVTPPALPSRKLQDKYHYHEFTAEELIKYIINFGFELSEPMQTVKHRMYAKFILQ